jgi:TonB family protein
MEPALGASAPVVELRGVGLRQIARDQTAALRAGHDLGNVVPFIRARRDNSERQAPAIVVAAAERLGLADFGRAKWWAAFLLCSVAIHAGVYFSFHDEAPPAASIGLESISVELMLGANMAAGPTQEKGESDISAPAPAMAPDPVPEAPLEPEQTEKPIEQAKVAEPEASNAPPPASEKPVKSQPAEVAAAAPVTPVNPVPNAPETPAPVQAVPAPEPKEAELQASINPSQPVEATETHVYETAATPKPKVAEPRREIERQKQREEARREKARQEKLREAQREKAKREKAEREKRRAAAVGERNNSRSMSNASTAAGGVGRGHSERNSNYRGIVAAHLARYKQFPADARSRGDQGVASVTFTLSGSGSVTSARLARSSGVASLDREVTAMVRRASPFPPPPDGRSASFTVPISFRVR